MALEVPSSQEAKKIPPSPADQLREALDAKQPSYQEYIKSKGYLEMAVNDSEVRMAYRTIGKTQGRVGMPDHYLLDISLLLQDKEWVRQILDQNIDTLVTGERGKIAFSVTISYITNEGLRRSKIVVLEDADGGIFANGTVPSNNNLAIRNLTVFKK